MPKPLTEFILARLTTPDRAAAVYGDLTEMAATRGRLYFWTAYARTFIALGWRVPVAFLIALASVRVMGLIYPRWVHYILRHLQSEGQVSMSFGQLAVASGPLLNAIAMCLWFALPFAWMRFGLRDRLTRFACALFVCTLPVFSFQAWLIDLSSVITLLAILAALVSSRWRRPLAVLVATLATAVVAVTTCFRILAAIDHQRFITYSTRRGVGWLTIAFALSIAAIVCCTLHNRLLRPNGAAYAQLT